MRCSLPVVAFLLAVGLAAVATGAAAEEGRRFDVKVTVVKISENAGSIDAGAEKIHSHLRKKFRYESLRVLDDRSLNLAIDEVGSVKLPNGQMFRVRPMNLGDRGLLMAVGLEGAMMMDMRAPSHHLLVIGGPDYEDGQLVVSVEPDY